MGGEGFLERGCSDWVKMRKAGPGLPPPRPIHASPRGRFIGSLQAGAG